MSNRIAKINNFLTSVNLTGRNGGGAQTLSNVTTGRRALTPDMARRNLSFTISPVQFARIKQDIKTWREAVQEAEQAWFPHRVKMQRIFQDTVLDGHVDACMDKRRKMTTLRKFRFRNAAGVTNEEVTKMFQNQPWFKNCISFVVDTAGYGYTLIAMGDIINDAFPNLSFVRRWDVSPDRKVVTRLTYSLFGTDFEAPEFKPWHIYVTTPTDLGVSPTGYGYLYKVARYEILIRNNLGFNADYNEVNGQPIRKGSTTKTDPTERDVFENSLASMGSNAYILLDEGQDSVELIEAKNVGTAHVTYSDLEMRCQKIISKLILGHADAIDSVPGKLGNDGEESPAAQALEQTQVEDGVICENIVNSELLWRMRELGIQLPDDLVFEFLNDAEKEETRTKENENADMCADTMVKVKNAGGKPDWKWFNERTGMNIEEAPEPEPVVPGLPLGPDAKKVEAARTEKVKNKLEKIYGHGKRK